MCLIVVFLFTRCCTALHKRKWRTILVSVGINQPYEGNLIGLRKAAQAIGFDRVMLWDEAQFLHDKLTRKHLSKFLELNHSTSESILCKSWGKWCRPYCAAFKPVALLRAMSEAQLGDYVLWADASRYSNYSSTLQERNGTLNIVSAVEGLRASAIRFNQPASMYGSATCSCAGRCASNGAYAEPAVNLVWPFAPWNDQFECSIFQDFNISHASSFIRDLWFTNAHILLENTIFNRMLLLEWLSLALQNPSAFCRSHPQDQSAWSIVASRHRLPLVAFHAGYTFKNISNVIDGLSLGEFCWANRSDATGFARGLSHYADFAPITECG